MVRESKEPRRDRSPGPSVRLPRVPVGKSTRCAGPRGPCLVPHGVRDRSRSSLVPGGCGWPGKVKNRGEDGVPDTRSVYLFNGDVQTAPVRGLDSPSPNETGYVRPRVRPRGRGEQDLGTRKSRDVLRTSGVRSSKTPEGTTPDGGSSQTQDPSFSESGVNAGVGTGRLEGEWEGTNGVSHCTPTDCGSTHRPTHPVSTVLASTLVLSVKGWVERDGVSVPSQSRTGTVSGPVVLPGSRR